MGDGERNKLVLITRPLSGAGDSKVKIEALGFRVMVEPMLSIQDVEFDVPDVGEFQALVFTSVHGVEAFSQCSDTRDVRVYVVGARTGEVARACGFVDVIVGGGDVRSLARTITRNGHDQRSFLHVCGADVAGDLKSDLNARGYRLERLVVYKALAAKSLSDECVEAMRTHRIDVVTFYSTRTAAAFVRLVVALNLEAALAHIKVLCISQSVLECVQPDKWSEVYVASQPDEANLLTLLQRHVH